MIVIQFLLFLIVSFLVLYIPGRYLVRRTGFEHKEFIITFSVSFGVGISLFLVATYILAWINVSFIYSLLIIPIIFLEWKPSFFELKKYVHGKTFLTFEALLIAIGTVCMTYLAFRSGSIENGKLVFFGIHAVDSVYHQSLIGNLIHSFPPTHPGIAGYPLRGYNFFYDFLTVQFAKHYFLDRFDLFFRLMPLLTSFFYGISGLALLRYFSLNRLATLTALYLLYFTQNFEYFFRLLPDNFVANFNFEIIQSFGNIHDPSVVFSTTLLFLATITLFRLKKPIQWIIPGLILGCIPTMKIHTGVIAFAPLFLIAFYAFIRYRDVRYGLVLALSGIIAAITYLPINFGAGHLIFSPFHLYRHYMDSAPMFRNAHWSVQYQIFQQHSNYLRMGFINVVAMLAYLLPNLGLRLVSLLLIPKLFKKSYWTYPKAYFALTLLISILVPTLFIQSVYAFVIIQFLWVASILLVFPTAVVVASFVRNNHLISLVIYCLVILGLTLPGTIIEIVEHSHEPYEVQSGVYELSTIIPELITPDESVFVVNRIQGDLVYAVPLISALSGRSVYYEHEVLEFSDTAEEIEKRIRVVDKVSSQLSDCYNPNEVSLALKETLMHAGSNYLLIFKNNQCMEKLSGFDLIKQIEDTSLYKIQ